MNKLLILFAVGLLLVSSVSAYYCVYQEEPAEVQYFKSIMNTKALINDIDNGLTEEGLALKLKYFYRCK